MKNFSHKILFLVLMALTFLQLQPQAQAKNQAQLQEANSQTFEDPDLKLSIEELRKKYPITLLDKKKAAYKPGQKINIDDYSIEEIKAAFLNADKNFISSKSISEVPDIKAGKTNHYLLMNNVAVHNQLELDIIDAACSKFGSAVFTKPKKYQLLQSFLFSSDKIQHHVNRFIPRKTENCFIGSDPFELEDRN